MQKIPGLIPGGTARLLMFSFKQYPQGLSFLPDRRPLHLYWLKINIIYLCHYMGILMKTKVMSSILLRPVNFTKKLCAISINRDAFHQAMVTLGSWYNRLVMCSTER